MATNTAATFTNHTGNGTAGPFSISFSYLTESEVDVTVGGVLKTITTHYTFTSATQITFTSGNEPANGVAIKFQRDTDISAKKVDFVDGSVLTESDLDTQNNQLLFAQQEIVGNIVGLTNAQVRTAVESATDSNVFTDDDHSKLNGIEAGATADQTNAEIRAAVEAASDSNVFTDADHAKLNGIQAGATVNASDEAGLVKYLRTGDGVYTIFTPDGTTVSTSNISATYGQSGNTITITKAGHNYPVGSFVNITFTGGAANGTYKIQTVAADENSFTVTAGASATISNGTACTFQTVTEGLQEAINHANANGLDFYCAGGGIRTEGNPNTDVGVISCTGTLQIPACQNRSFVFKSVTLDFSTALGNNPGLKFDSFMMMDFDFAGQVGYHGNGNAVEFDAQNVVPLDNMRGQVDSRIKIDTIAYIEGGTGASPLSSCVSFIRTHASLPATSRNHFKFGEINASGFDGTNVTLIARNGMVINHSGFAGNIIDIQGIHHYKEAGLIVGQSVASPAPFSNTFRIGLLEPFRVTSGGSVVAVGLRSYATRNDYNFAITNNGGINQGGVTGAFAHAVLLESSANNEHIFLRNSQGATTGLISSNSSNNNTLYFDGHKLDGNFLVGTPIENVFNGAGGNSQMVVAGTDTNTVTHSNVNASITISNKDGTANNLAGLHFAREDNDGSPHYVGASVVAQFLETMVDGQYPKANLSFLTSSSANAAPTEKMVLAADGKLGLGTNSPTYPISIVKSGGGDAATLGIQNTGNDPAGIHLLSGHGNWSIFNSATVGNNFEIRDDSLSVFLINADHDIQLSDGTTARNQITSDHSDATDAVNRKGFHMTDGPAIVHSDGSNDRAFEVFTSHGGAAGSNRAKLNFRVEGDGDVRNTNNSYGSLSDQKLKQDIVDAGSQWEDIKAVKVKKFKFKDHVANLGADNAVLQIGVVAQDLEAAGMSGLVKETPDIIDNVDQGTVTKSVKYSVLYMKAIKCLQEAMAKIEVLEAKVAALEAAD